MCALCVKPYAKNMKEQGVKKQVQVQQAEQDSF